MAYADRGYGLLPESYLIAVHRVTVRVSYIGADGLHGVLGWPTTQRSAFGLRNGVRSGGEGD